MDIMSMSGLSTMNISPQPCHAMLLPLIEPSSFPSHTWQSWIVKLVKHMDNQGAFSMCLRHSKTPDWQLAIHSICGICLISFFFGSSTKWQPPETLDELGASAAQEMLPQHCWIWRGCQSLPAVFPSAEPRTIGFWVPKYHVVNPYEPDIYIYYIMNIRFGMVSIPPISIPP